MARAGTNDSWDFDGVNEFVTFDMDGKRVGGKADRNGFFYVNDAATGTLINAFPFVRKITWTSSVDLKTGRPNFIADNRPGDPTAGTDGKKGSAVFAAPGFLGGKNQMPMAYSPDTKMFYVPANEWGSSAGSRRRAAWRRYADGATCSALQIGSTPRRARCSSTKAFTSCDGGRAPPGRNTC